MAQCATLLSLAALALGAAACGGLGQAQPQNPSRVAKGTIASMPSATDINTSSPEAPEWGMPALTPARGTSGGCAPARGIGETTAPP